MDSRTRPTTDNQVRRWLSLLLVVSLLGATCSGPTNNSGIVDSFPSDPVVLEVWRPLDEGNAYIAAAEAYHNLHQNVTIDYRYFKAATFEEELIDALANGEGPDIVALNNDRMPAFINKLQPMPEGFFGGSNLVSVITARYAPAVATDTIFNERIYGIPLSTESLVIYVNEGLTRELYEEYNREGEVPNQDLLLRTPADWDELIKMTKLIVQRNGGQISRAAIGLGISSNVPRTADIIAAMFLQRGIKMTSADRQNATFHLPDANRPSDYPGANILEYLKGFVDPNSSYYSWNADMPNALEAFIDGKVAMLIHHPGAASYIRQRNPNLNFKIGPFPQVPNATKIVDYAIYPIEAVTNDADQSEVAWDFLQFITNNTLSIYTNQTGRTEPTRQIPGAATVSERVGISSGTLALQVPTAVSWHKGQDAAESDAIIATALDRVTREGQSARESLNQAAAALTQLLASP